MDEQPSPAGMTTMQDLEDKIARLKREVARKDSALADRNRQLDAMAWVWCDGGCAGGVFRFTPTELTEDVVVAAERNVKRLRTWYTNASFRQRWAKMTDAERAEWIESHTKPTPA